MHVERNAVAVPSPDRKRQWDERNAARDELVFLETSDES
jgi:hypothetical protein